MGQEGRYGFTSSLIIQTLTEVSNYSIILQVSVVGSMMSNARYMMSNA